MARTDIARIVARAVVEDVIDSDSSIHGDAVVEATDALLKAALSVKRRRVKLVGEVVELVFAVPPDPTTPED